jgi:hypothetical protein
MKKFFTLSLLFILSGCTWFGGGESDPSLNSANYPYYSEVQGYLATESWKPGVLYTHRLDDIIGDFIIGLKSTEINLSKYDDSEIIAKGQVTLASDNATEVLLVESVDTIQSPEKFRTFSTGSLDFSFQYPESLTVRKLVSGVKLKDADDTTVFYITQEPKSGDSLSDLVKGISLTGSLVLETNLSIEGVSAIRRVEEINGVRFTTVFMLGRDNFYTLKFLNPDESLESDWSEAFDEILTSFTASDLGAVEGTGEVCGGAMEIACPNDLTCLLDGDYPDAQGICVTEQAYEQDLETLRTACNNTEGFIQAVETECDYTTCQVLPTCECSGARVWDQIEGCISADSVDIAPEGEPTAVPDLTISDDDTEDDDSDNDTDNTSDDDEITPSSQISGETRTMESDPWNFELQYPKNWYFMSLGGGKYAFAPDEDPELNPAVTVAVVDSCSSATGSICTEVGSKTFELSYASGYSAEASGMSASIQLTSN